MVEINVDKEVIKRVDRMLKNIPDGSKKAIVNATNRALAKGKTMVKKGIVTRYTIKSSKVEETLSINKASFSRLGGSVVSSGPVISLSKFKTKPGKVTSKRPRALKVEVKKGQVKPISHAFMAQTNTGHIGVFLRKGERRLPIEDRKGPSIPSMAKNINVVEIVQQEMNETFYTRLNHEIDRLLKRG